MAEITHSKIQREQTQQKSLANKDFLLELLRAQSPVGNEESAARLWREQAKSFADEVKTDLLGNTIATVNKGGGPKVTLMGHLDEIALIITRVDDKGFLWFKGLGGWDPQVLVGQRITILASNGPIQGVIGKKAIHLQEAEERKQVSELKNLWVDCGFIDEKQASEFVRVGDTGVITYDAVELQNDRLAGRGIDNRVGGFVALEVARALSAVPDLGVEVNTVATVQEEIGTVGGRVASFSTEPYVGFAYDVNHATDNPLLDDAQKTHGFVTLGGGPTLARGPNINPILHDLMVEMADKHKISYQLTAESMPTGTDGRELYKSRSGCATAVIGIPNRYMHSPSEIVSYADIQASIDLSVHVISAIDENTDFTPWGR